MKRLTLDRVIDTSCIVKEDGVTVMAGRVNVYHIFHNKSK